MKEILGTKNYIQFLAVIFSLLIFTSASAQNEWIPAGLADINIYDFEVLDSWLYASTSGDEGAVHSTASFGADWTELSDNLPSDQTAFVSLAIKGSDVYAAAQYRGLYALRGGVEPWVKVPVAGGLLSVVSILFAGEPWNRTFLGGSKIKGTTGVAMSENEITWTGISDGLPVVGAVYSLISRGSAIYAATDDGVYRLDFGSDEWVISSSAGLQFIDVNELAHNGNYFFAGSDHGVFRSSDGQTWDEMNVGLATAATDYNAFVFDGVNAFVASSGQFGGVYHSNNDGDSWVKINEGFPDDISIHALIAHGPYLFAGSGANGVYRRERLVTAVNDNAVAPLFNIYPNPNDGQFKIQIGHNQSLTGRIIITDILGRNVYDTPFVCHDGNYDIGIQLDETFTGLYFLLLKGEDYDLSRKMIIR